jgi:hypothetical protein
VQLVLHAEQWISRRIDDARLAVEAGREHDLVRGPALEERDARRRIVRPHRCSVARLQLQPFAEFDAGDLADLGQRPAHEQLGCIVQIHECSNCIDEEHRCRQVRRELSRQDQGKALRPARAFDHPATLAMRTWQ